MAYKRIAVKDWSIDGEDGGEGGRTLSLEDKEDHVARQETHLGDAVRVTKATLIWDGIGRAL